MPDNRLLTRAATGQPLKVRALQNNLGFGEPARHDLVILSNGAAVGPKIARLLFDIGPASLPPPVGAFVPWAASFETRPNFRSGSLFFISCCVKRRLPSENAIRLAALPNRDGAGTQLRHSCNRAKS